MKTTFTKEEKKKARLAYSNLKQLPDKFNSTRLEILKAFSSASIPNWGGLIFNGQKVY